MTYSVKEIFYTLQGEGMNVGRPAVFCRFSGCNLWTGREQHRDRAICQFCDTEFVGTDGVGGGKFKHAQDLALAVATTWDAVSSSRQHAFVVCTGGEPLLQLDNAAIDALHDQDFEIAVETNGTQSAPANIDWLCVSPKARAPLRQVQGHELKLVYPQHGAEPERFESLAFEHFFLQPMDGPQREENTQRAIEYCSSHPRWRLSVQTHKLIGIP
ncbi:MAG: 7-carboxy-7-deazaguanine synthase [Gammaproteobacteria bacterium]|jgi:7-carboxy-7-deazaguanine synthase